MEDASSSLTKHSGAVRKGKRKSTRADGHDDISIPNGRVFDRGRYVVEGRHPGFNGIRERKRGLSVDLQGSD